MADEHGRDTLTGLMGHDAFCEALEGALASNEPEWTPVSLIILDVDKLGEINEGYGRALGDQMLVRLARHLQACAGKDGHCFRDAADRFCVLLAGLEKERAFLMAEAARSTLAGIDDFRMSGGLGLAMPSFSAGVTCSPDDGTRLGELMRKAQGALYRAKLAGGDRVCLAKEDKMVTKTSHYTTEQLQMLSRLSKREGLGEAVLLREALDDLIKKYDRRDGAPGPSTNA